MKLIVPYVGEIEPVDARLLRLAEFCGVPCETLSLSSGVSCSPAYLSAVIRDDHSCFVVNASVMRKWSSAELFPSALDSYLTSRFPFLLVHNFDQGSFAASMLWRLSGGRLKSLRPVTGSQPRYRVASGYESVCGVFSGLEFTQPEPVSDHVFAKDHDSVALQTLISIDDQPLFAIIPRDHARVFFLASETIDLDTEAAHFRSLQHFSRLVPPVMFFRHAFRQECWRPHVNHATLIIDDPLLQKRYGFLNYGRLLELMDRYDFHTSIAFIPHNRFRTSPAIARLFAARPDRYSLCIHGNNHTAGELGTPDVAKLNALLQTAVRRMDVHRQQTSIPYDKVMVFPQGSFSESAMTALRANNFSGAVNSHPHGHGRAAHLRLADYIQPAITRYGGFPLYLRKYVRDLAPYDAAFNLFFGQPVFIVEHHIIFKDADRVTELVSRINSLAPDIQWSNLQTAIENSFVQREMQNGTVEVLTYAGCGRLETLPEGALRCSVVKSESPGPPAHQVFVNERLLAELPTGKDSIAFSFDLTDGGTRSFSVHYRNELPLSESHPGICGAIKILLRRRASEIRDNYLSMNPWLLSTAQSVRARLRNADTDTPR